MSISYFEIMHSAANFVPLCNSINGLSIVLELSKPTKDLTSLLVCTEKQFLGLCFSFFVGDVISGVAFWPFWLRLPGPEPNH